MYIDPGKPLSWNLGKNLKLKTEHGVSFEDVQRALEKGAYRLVENTSRNHPGQRCLLITLQGIPWRVPFREYRDHIHLFTIMRAP